MKASKSLKTAGLLLLGLSLASACTRAGEARVSPDWVIRQAGVSGGLFSFPRASAGDQQLIIDLAKRPTMVVHAMAADEKLVDRLRAAGEAAGLLGRSLYVECGKPDRLPFADRLVDCLVITDIKDRDLTPALRVELLRVLAPRRGAAVLGSFAPGGTGKAALKAWISGLSLSRMATSKAGTWALLKAELPTGSNAWTHRCHGPDNVQVSQDTTFRPPFMTQWWAPPRMEGFWGTTVVSGNGRIFTVRASRRPQNPVVLTARSLTSGLVLWRKELRGVAGKGKAGTRIPHGGYIPSRMCIAVDGDTLCLIDRDGVVRLDAETGKQRDRIAGPKTGGQIKWLGISGAKLAMMAGEADVIQPITYQTVAGNPVGRDLAVYDLATGKKLWHRTVGGDIDERAVAIRGGRLVYLCQGTGVVARGLVDGKQVWCNSDAALQANFRTPKQKTVGKLLSSQPLMVATGDVIVMRTPWAKQVYGLSAANGNTLWKRASGLTYRALQALPFGKLWLGPRGLSIDMKTGETVRGPKFMSSGCGPTTSVPGYFITCFGAVVDATTGKRIRPADLKSPCDVGSLVSEGIMVTVPSECKCKYELKCYRALASAGKIKPHAALPAAGRLVVSDRTQPAALEVSDADWPTYRHDAARSGSSPVKIGKGAKILWHWKPTGPAPSGDSWGPSLTPDFIPTAAVAAAGYVWFASHDGVVRCVRAEGGKELWRFATRAMIFAPPTLWKGRLLVGGGDGRVYCLNAVTGKLLWKLLLAPGERRLFWMGHLINTWPVTGGVVVHDGVGYAVAGYAAENGIYACAFDPATGKVAWEKHDAGAAGMVSGGGVAVSGERLCLAGMTGGSFDLKTGAHRRSRQGYGQEVAVLCNKWVIGGGRRLTELQVNIASHISGWGRLPGHTSLPVWDKELVVLGPKGPKGDILAVTSEKYAAFRAAPPPKRQAGKPRPKKPDVADVKLWASKSVLASAFVLTRDSVVAAVAASGRSGHRLVALRRSDGMEMWSVPLPGQPAMNRLAVDRGSRVIVGLCDGSVICVGR